MVIDWTQNRHKSYRTIEVLFEFSSCSWRAGFAVGYQVTDWLQPEIEVSFVHEFVRRDRDAETFALTGGVILNPADGWRVDLGVTQGVWGRNADRVTAFTAVVSRTF